MLIIPPGFLQAAYTFSLANDSEPIIVTCGHEIDGTSGATGEEAANDLFSSFSTNIVTPLMSDEYTLEYVATYIGQDGPTLVNLSDETPVTGTVTASIVPQNTAYLIRKRTDLGGRRGRGRMYLPGVLENDVDSVGGLSTTITVPLQAGFDAWYDDLTAMVGGRLYPPVVLHRSEGIGAEPPPTPVTRFVVENKVATQRRRLRP